MTPTPRYRQIADDLRRRLADEEFGPVGSKIPPIAELQREYDCENNLNMIRHAQSVLIDEGLIEPRQGQGTFVIAVPPRQDNQDDLSEAAEELRIALGTAQAALAKFISKLTPPPSDKSRWPK
ncbi:winged helix-turn-helix domain-containing protein [Micromonospora halophytica]|uniref:Regulatory protein, gntR family n=1 Tax=Micromonospora halophytica TaxID=47864 RepID=A0A1C5INN3_9ACTN|nr:winged helix-turn-helix domain-containing protein [Micromonospora halophytica]SCG59629.1 regulatory protein, gntR family [Micromonospora halophytica]